MFASARFFVMTYGYMEIADLLEHEIASGALPLGSKVPSRRILCKRFGISNVTAARVHNELADRDLVLKIRGSGVEVLGPFIPPKAKKHYSEIRHLFFIHNTKSGLLPPIQMNLVDLLRNYAVSHNVEFHTQYDISISPREVRDVMKAMDKKHAYIISVPKGCPNKLPMSYLYLLNLDIKTVLIDGVIPQSHCVMPDNYGGMELLVDYVQKRGARSVLYLSKFYSLGNANDSERLHGCLSSCQRRNIKFQTIDTAHYKDVLEIFRSGEAPDAVMCPQDAVAVRLLRTMDDACLKKYPLVTGFDDFSIIGKDPRVATIERDRAAIADAALNFIFNCPANPIIHEVKRISGKLKLPKHFEAAE
jgi:DNA-binding transcriptional regulator YhcF (GntR family)